MLLHSASHITNDDNHNDNERHSDDDERHSDDSIKSNQNININDSRIFNRIDVQTKTSSNSPPTTFLNNLSQTSFLKPKPNLTLTVQKQPYKQIEFTLNSNKSSSKSSSKSLSNSCIKKRTN